MNIVNGLQLIASHLKNSKNFPRINPMLATLAKEIPTEEDWIFETKYDGYRILAKIHNKKVKLLTREEKDWTKKFPIIKEEAEKLKVRNVILDGEMVVERGGVSIFQELQNIEKTGDDSNLYYYVFDILYLNDKNLTKLPLFERKEILKNILGISLTSRIRFSDYQVENPKRIFEKACQKGLEGIVAKKIDGEYEGKRSKSWLKIKCIKRQEFVVGGFTEVISEDKEGIGALLLGVYDNGKFRYVGKTGTGFSNTLRVELWNKLQKLKQNNSPFTNQLKEIPKEAIWVRPEIVVEASFAEWTQAGLLRQAVFQGIREDKPPKLITREEK